MKNFTKNYMVSVVAVLLLGLTITMNAQNKIPRDGLIVYYPFNNDFNDKSGNNFNGKVNEAVLTGAKNKACFFDGINDYIEVPGIEALKTAEQLTVSCWIKPFTADAYDSWISKTNENNSNSQWRLSFGQDPNNMVQFTIFNKDWTDYDVAFQFEMKKWYHVLYLIDNTNHKASIYIDGENIKSFDIGEISSSNGPLLIGCQSGGWSYYNGLVDETLIYSRLLKENEINILYDHFKNSDKAEMDPLLIASIQRKKEIQEAVTAGDLEKVRELIEADPSLLESKDDNGYTPLMTACKTLQVEVANYLIDKGANVNAKNRFGITPLFCFSYNKEAPFDLIRRLITKGADVNAKLSLNRNWTVLVDFVMKGNIKVVKLLIDHGADLNVRDIEGTPLQMAIHHKRNEDMAVFLVESGAKLQEFSFGNTDLHLAAIWGFADLARVLIKHDADINAVNDYGHTPLYYAARHGQRKAAEALIAAGAGKNAIVETNYGKAPQLTEQLREGEAYLWHLAPKLSPNTGYVVKTSNNLLIFDPAWTGESPEAGLANGFINPNELACQKITVLIGFQTPSPGDRPDIPWLAKRIPGTNFVLGFKPNVGDEEKGDMPPYRLAVAHESFSMEEIQVHTIPAASRLFGKKGLGYLIEADGVKIFHAGLHFSDNNPSNVAKYRKEIDFLKPFGPIDIAILPIRGRHLESLDYEPYLYLIDQLAPKAIYLIGEELVIEEPRKCLEVLSARDVPVFYPDGGIAIGQRFHYVQDRTQK
jgi:ankyrin repeat protein